MSEKDSSPINIEHSFESPITPGHSINWIKTLLAAVVGVSLLFIGVAIGAKYFSNDSSELMVQENTQAITQDPTILTPTPEQPIISTPTVTIANDSIARWQTYDNAEHQITFQYPPDWSIDSTGQMFEQGDLIRVKTVGETQQENTEFYDGATVTVMIPIALTGSLEEWVNKKYIETVNGDPYEHSSRNIAGIEYRTVYGCGLGCFMYYYTEHNNKIYGFVTFSGGPNKELHDASINQILASFKFTDSSSQ